MQMQRAWMVLAVLAAGCGTEVGASVDAAPDGGPSIGEPEEILSDELGVSAIVADEERIYFTNWGGSVWSATHDGEDVTELADTTAYGLAADATHLYWTTDLDIRRVKKSGGRTQIVATLRDTSNGLAAALELALDEDHVYASTYEDGTVVRAPKAGGAIEELARAETGLMGGIDVAEGLLYWADYDLSGQLFEQRLGTGESSPVASTSAARIRKIADDLWLTRPIAPYDPSVELVRLPLDGSPATHSPPAPFSFGFEYDGRHVYWVLDGGGLVRIDPASNLLETVATGIPGEDLEQVAIAGDWLFVTNGAYPGGIFRIARPH
jgi:hypothetical protein